MMGKKRGERQKEKEKKRVMCEKLYNRKKDRKDIKSDEECI